MKETRPKKTPHISWFYLYEIIQNGHNRQVLVYVIEEPNVLRYNLFKVNYTVMQYIYWCAWHYIRYHMFQEAK